MSADGASTDCSMAADLTGMLVCGQYRVSDMLATGGMAHIYEAFDEQAGVSVVLKVLHSRFASQPRLVERFRREAATAASLDSFYIGGVTGQACWRGHHFMVMPRLQGEDLQRTLLGRQPSLQRCVDWTLDICRALKVVHGQSFVHRDIKPANIFIARAAEYASRAILLDFGVAKGECSLANGLTEEGSLLGTVGYMAPEQITEPAIVDHRADLYSLALVLFEALSGKAAYSGERADILYRVVHEEPQLAERLEGVPSRLVEIIVQAAAQDREKRFDSVDDFATALAPFAETGLLASLARAEAGKPSLPFRTESDSTPPMVQECRERDSVSHWRWGILCVPFVLLVGGLVAVWSGDWSENAVEQFAPRTLSLRALPSSPHLGLEIAPAGKPEVAVLVKARAPGTPQGPIPPLEKQARRTTSPASSRQKTVNPGSMFQEKNPYAR